MDSVVSHGRKLPVKRRKLRETLKKATGPRSAVKTVYRVKAQDQKGRAKYFKTRTKMKESTIQRMCTLRGLDIERVTR